MDNNFIISDTSKHIGELRNAIAQDILPSKAQCEELIGDLDNIQRLISERNFIMQHSIEELYDDFSVCSDKIKSCLNGMSDMISAGKVPDKGVVDAFVNSLAELREKYSYVYQSALLQIPSFEMPEDGAGAGEYAYAVKNSKTLILRKKVKEATECLNMFLSVRSDIEARSSAIAPYQKEAGEILEHLSEYGIEDFEQIEDKLKGQKALVDAVLCQDKDSDEGMALCDTVTQYYPNRISMGVGAGKYYLEATESEPESGENSDEKPMVTVSPDTEEKDNSGLIYLLHENDCFINSCSDIGEVKEYINPHEKKSICPSSFCTDMRRGNLSAEKSIMNALACYNCFTKKILRQEMQMKNRDIENVISYMTQKGYLRTYSIEPYGDEIYFASPRMLEALTVSSCNFLEIKTGSVKNFIDFDKHVTAEKIASALAYAELTHDFVSRNSLKNLKAETNFSDDSFCSVMEDGNNPSIREMAVGIFWTSDQNCNLLVNSINSMIKKYEKISTLTVASLDKKHASANAEVLMKFLGNNLAYTDIRLYALKEREYYGSTYNPAI